MNNETNILGKNRDTIHGSRSMTTERILLIEFRRRFFPPNFLLYNLFNDDGSHNKSQINHWIYFNISKNIMLKWHVNEIIYEFLFELFRVRE